MIWCLCWESPVLCKTHKLLVKSDAPGLGRWPGYAEDGGSCLGSFVGGPSLESGVVPASFRTSAKISCRMFMPIGWLDFLFFVGGLWGRVHGSVCGLPGAWHTIDIDWSADSQGEFPPERNCKCLWFDPIAIFFCVAGTCCLRDSLCAFVRSGRALSMNRFAAATLTTVLRLVLRSSCSFIAFLTRVSYWRILICRKEEHISIMCQPCLHTSTVHYLILTFSLFSFSCSSGFRPCTLKYSSESR